LPARRRTTRTNRRKPRRCSRPGCRCSWRCTRAGSG
jgi:hypothetical protein